MLSSIVRWSHGSLTEIRVRHCSDRSLALVAESFLYGGFKFLVQHVKPYVGSCCLPALNMIELRFSCPNLEVLSIRSCPHVTDDSISRIALRCPKLRELDVSYCYEISHVSLALVGKNCPNLKVLKRNLMNWLDPSLEIRFSKLSAKGLSLICERCSNLEFLDFFK
ncbi:hypothetical protein Ahy_B09g098589 [Arachis hypogaea]|uniref:F-box/LRR-repeat protein n=1 Tax=Arachis hypogaea TaxID=3818 RepID=A0A444XS98_ARAHY|nr:hypothetical protein Ahy_B09g098589 [Arachis hypogaea]